MSGPIQLLDSDLNAYVIFSLSQVQSPSRIFLEYITLP